MIVVVCMIPGIQWEFHSISTVSHIAVLIMRSRLSFTFSPKRNCRISSLQPMSSWDRDWWRDLLLDTIDPMQHVCTHKEWLLHLTCGSSHIPSTNDGPGDFKLVYTTPRQRVDTNTTSGPGRGQLHSLRRICGRAGSSLVPHPIRFTLYPTTEVPSSGGIILVLPGLRNKWFWGALGF